MESKNENAKTIKDKEDDCQSDGSGDFYGKLRNMYNSPKTTPNKNEDFRSKLSKLKASTEKVNFIQDQNKFDMYTRELKQFLSKYPTENALGQDKRNKVNDKIKFNQCNKDNIKCDSSHYEEPSMEDLKSIDDLRAKVRKMGGLDGDYSDSDENDPEMKLPREDELPDDPDELESIMKSMIEKYDSIGNKPKGSSGSEKTFKYKLDDMWDMRDPSQSVTGIRKCTCPDTVVIDGTDASLKDIKNSVKELQENHNVGKVVIKIKKGDHKVNDAIDTSDKLKDHRGFVLLTAYTLQRICNSISKHPCLGTIVFEYVPLSASLLVLLIPGFANLTTLRLVGAKLLDDGVEKLCPYLSKSKPLKILDFSDNGITKLGAGYVAKLVEKKGYYRFMEKDWSALERLTLNNNPLGNKGLMPLLNILKADLFMKAVDLRDCDIDMPGPDILNHIYNNFDLQVFDLRKNRIQNVALVIKHVLFNCPLNKTTYKWDDEEEIKKYL